MKLKLIPVLTLLLCLVIISKAGAYGHQTLENYIAYRIKYVHNKAYNTNVILDKKRVKSYARKIVYWSDYYSEKLETVVDPLLLTAILETETNFVSRDDYDQGRSIGISSMRVDTAKWIASNLSLEYNKYRMLDPTDYGIRFTAYYLALAYKKYQGDITKIIVSYNQGFNAAQKKNIDLFYNEYLFKVLGRCNYYKRRITSYGSIANKSFALKLLKLK